MHALLTSEAALALSLVTVAILPIRVILRFKLYLFHAVLCVVWLVCDGRYSRASTELRRDRIDDMIRRFFPRASRLQTQTIFWTVLVISLTVITLRLDSHRSCVTA